jgi:hypothetical protein
MRSTSAKVAAVNGPDMTWIPGSAALSFAANGGVGLVSATRTFAPRAARWRVSE